MSESIMHLSLEERMQKLSKMQPHDRLAFVPKGYCFICADDAEGNVVKCQRDGWVTSCAVHNAESKVCPQCKDPDCRRPPVNHLHRDDLIKNFPDAAEAISQMNPSMYLQFKKTSVEFGITEAEEEEPEGLTRGSKAAAYANAKAYTEKGKGHVTLDEGEFTGWSFCMRSASALGAGLDMLRTTVRANGDKDTENIGPAMDWLTALLYGDNAMYPTLVGHVDNGLTVEIALACNPALPGFLLLSNKTPALTAVDIPSKVWKGMATFNDPRVFALSALGSPVELMQLCVSYVEYPYYIPAPDVSFRDATGCLVEEYHGIEKGRETVLELRSLKGGELQVYYKGVKKDGTCDLASGDQEPMQYLVPFWGGLAHNVLKLKAEIGCDEFGDAWGLEVPGLPGVFFYKCVFRP